MVKRRKMGTTGGNQKSELQRETPILHSNSERLHLTAREVERLAPPTVSAVPEPSSLLLLLSVVVAWLHAPSVP